jgi:polynucleotide 5'-kinase involved in rRNA processing
MADAPDSVEEKSRKLEEAYAEFMEKMRTLEQEKIEVMKRVMGDMEKEEIEQLLNDLNKP